MKSERELDLRIKAWRYVIDSTLDACSAEAKEYVEGFIKEVMAIDAKLGPPTVGAYKDTDAELQLVLHEAGDLLMYEPCVTARCGCVIHESGRTRRCKEHASYYGQ